MFLKSHSSPWTTRLVVGFLERSALESTTHVLWDGIEILLTIDNGVWRLILFVGLRCAKLIHPALREPMSVCIESDP